MIGVQHCTQLFLIEMQSRELLALASNHHPPNPCQCLAESDFSIGSRSHTQISWGQMRFRIQS
jgi:hypothetical protein